MTQLLRMTHQREIILAELKKMTTHPTADELYERVKKRLPRISLATVYRNLEILSALGIIRKLEISGRQKRFDWDTHEHFHVYCTCCHRVENVALKKTATLPLQISRQKGYEISGCRVEFFGLCPTCKNKKKKKENKGETKMACKPKELSDKQREVLEALANTSDPCGSKDIAAVTSLETKQISCQITSLKKKGYVDSPARCKYAITDQGKDALTC